MIKNLGCLLGLVVLGCQKPMPPGYQGVIEFEERVVSFEASGRVTAVRVKRGEGVQPGQVVVELDDTLGRLTREARAGEVAVAAAEQRLVAAGSRPEEVAAAEAQVRAARETEGLLRRNAERVRGLVQSSVAPEIERDRAEAELARATAERQALEARAQGLRRGARREELARAAARQDAAVRSVTIEEERVTRYQLRPAVGGEVLDVHVEVGELAGAGAPALTLADTSRPFVDVFVPQGKLGGVRVGARALVRVDASATRTPGEVEWVSPRVEFTPRFLFSERERPNLVVRVRVRIDDGARQLHAGVPAFVEIER